MSGVRYQVFGPSVGGTEEFAEKLSCAGSHPGAKQAAPPESGGRPLERARMGAALPEDSGASHYVYEKTGAYRKFEGLGLNRMSLIEKELSKSGERGVEKRGTNK